MTVIIIEIIGIFLLLMVNGVFAMTEIAVVSARKARLRRLADEGDDRARVALDLAHSPNRFLSTVQIGITLVGVMAGAFGGAGLTELLFCKLDDLSTWSRHNAMNYAELMAWKILRSAGVSYPENCLLGVYGKPGS